MATFGDIKISTINGGPLSGMRNAVINGNFAINQRGVSGTVTLSAGAYGHDRFKAGAGGCTYTFATSQNVTTLTITAGTLIQVIEGANLLTDTYTLTFTGTAQGKIGAGSFSASGVTGSVTGGTNLNVEFNTGTVSLVQLERGSVATPFEFRSIGQELGLCQRYYYRNTGSNGSAFGGGTSSASTSAEIRIPLPVTMRASPTFSSGGNLVVTDSVSFNLTVTGTSGIFVNANKMRVFVIHGTGATVHRPATLSTTTSGFIEASAEL